MDPRRAGVVALVVDRGTAEMSSALTTLTDLALSVAAAGLPVFPCLPDKRPAISKDDGGRGFLDATIDPDVIVRLFDRPNAALIGTPTGALSGFDVLDVDQRHGGEAWEAENRYRLPETRIHQTMSGGRHWLFRHAEGVRNSASRVAPGIDIRGDGGYVIAPPSAGYTVVSDAEIAHWPDWLLALVLPAAPAERPLNGASYEPIASARIEGLVRSILGKVSAAPDGQKHFVLRNQALVLGGVQHLGGFSAAEMARRLVDALPASTRDREAARQTALWGLEAGARNPIDLPDRELSRGAPRQPRPEDDAAYWAVVESDPGLSATDWHDLEARETGHAIPASPEARAKAGPNLLWRITEPWDEASITARPWVAPGYLLRRAVTVLSGPSKAGKSSLVCAWCVALALGREFGRFRPGKPMRVITYNVEDDEEEQKRRFSAVCRQFGVTPADLIDNLVILGPSRVGTLLTFNRDGGPIVNTPVMDNLEEIIEQFKPDVGFLDPFVELHNSEENDNTAIRSVLARFRGFSADHNMAECILHHNRKGNGIATPGDPNSMRGASAIVGASRIAITLNTMTEPEAQGFGLPPDHHRSYFRIDGAGSNYAPSEATEWFERVEYQLDNGDGAAAAMPWSPPSTAITSDLIETLTGIVAQGPAQGLAWNHRLSDKEPRSILNAMVQCGISDRASQKKALADLLASGRITSARFRRPGYSASEPATGLRTSDGLPAHVSWIG